MMVSTLEEVCDLFGASHHTNESLSRRIYKDTECGAWASVDKVPKVRKVSEVWTVTYAKVDGVWQMVSAAMYESPCFVNEATTPVEFSRMAQNVKDYFWPPCDDIQSIVEELSEGRSNFSFTEILTAEYEDGHKLVFRCGSIVEGSDVEIHAQPVDLPADSSVLEKTVEWVNDEACLAWDQAHGDEDEDDGLPTQAATGGATPPGGARDCRICKRRPVRRIHMQEQPYGRT